MSAAKRTISDLALFGGAKLFESPRSTSNLVKPDFEKFLTYSRMFVEAQQYTNNGPVCRLLEQRLAAFHGTRHCVAFSNGFWGLVLALKTLALPGRAEVLMPSLTYRRLADVVAWAGLVPRFCEVDASTLAISPGAVKGNIGADTALILGVNPIVNCCDAEGLEAVAQRHGIPLLFDSVESVYETIAGQKVGSFGQAECFSLHASKLLNGFEGGYLTTNDDALAERLSLRRGFGFRGPDNVTELGTNAKLNEMHAAMALASLDDLDAQVDRNRVRYRAYQSALRDIPGIRLLQFDETERTSYKNIVMEIDGNGPLTRDQMVTILNAENILARAYYAPPLHIKKTAYRVVNSDLPVTEQLAQRFVLMPCGHFVDTQDIERIAGFVDFVVRHAADVAPRVQS